MDKPTQIFIIKQRILDLLVVMLQEKESALNKAIILEFAQCIHNFFVK